METTKPKRVRVIKDHLHGRGNQNYSLGCRCDLCRAEHNRLAVLTQRKLHAEMRKSGYKLTWVKLDGPHVVIAFSKKNRVVLSLQKKDQYV